MLCSPPYLSYRCIILSLLCTSLLNLDESLFLRLCSSLTVLHCPICSQQCSALYHPAASADMMSITLCGLSPHDLLMTLSAVHCFSLSGQLSWHYSVASAFSELLLSWLLRRTGASWMGCRVLSCGVQGAGFAVALAMLSKPPVC